MTVFVIHALWDHSFGQYQIDIGSPSGHSVVKEYWADLDEVKELVAMVRHTTLTARRHRFEFAIEKKANKELIDQWYGLTGTAIVEVNEDGSDSAVIWKSKPSRSERDGPAYCEVLSPEEPRSMTRTTYLDLVSRSRSSKAGVNPRADAARMVRTSLKIAGKSGKPWTVIAKEKGVGFDASKEFEDYLMTLYREQEGRCALTGLKLHTMDQANYDKARLASADRIDSNGQYAAGNLQIVCRFANQWKSNRSDTEFKRLLDLARYGDAAKGES